MTESSNTTACAPTSPIDPQVDSSPYPAVVVAADGTLQVLNRAARVVFPDARPGSPLPWPAPGTGEPGARAHGRIGSYTFEAHPVPHDDGTVTWWLVDDNDATVARAALHAEQATTAFLAEVSTALLGSLNLQRCMEITATLATGHLCDVAMVMAPPVRGGYPTVSSVRGGPTVTESLAVDPEEVPGLAEVLHGFPPVPSRWLDPASVPAWLRPKRFGEIGSIIVTPLPGHGVPTGALILLRGVGTPGFTENEEVVGRLFATRAGIAMSAARMYDRQASITEILMRELLPPTVRQLPGVDFAARYRASQDSERVGGDFYDVFPAASSDGEALVVLGDVCGKGIEAALLAGKIRTTMRALLPMAGDHQRLLSLLNTALLNAQNARFATLALASVTRDGASVRLRLTCGGHPAPVVVRADATVVEAATHGTLVGALPEITSTTAEVTLAPGEVCVLYTDGITEARGGPFGDEEFGEPRLLRTLAECAGMPAEAVVERVLMLAGHWVGHGPHDDMAILAIAAPTGRHLVAVGGHGRGRYTA